jgi:hypothetical protein
LPEEVFNKDILPDVKPLPSHQDTQQYSGADTQILPRPDLGQASGDTSQVVEEAGEGDSSYWRTQDHIKQYATADTQVMPKVKEVIDEATQKVEEADNNGIPEQGDTRQYAGADTQILPESAKAGSEVVDSAEHDDLDGDYWHEQTQILSKPPGWLDKK